MRVNYNFGFFSLFYQFCYWIRQKKLSGDCQKKGVNIPIFLLIDRNKYRDCVISDKSMVHLIHSTANIWVLSFTLMRINKILQYVMMDNFWSFLSGMKSLRRNCLFVCVFRRICVWQTRSHMLAHTDTHTHTHMCKLYKSVNQPLEFFLSHHQCIESFKQLYKNWDAWPFPYQ